MNIQRASLNDYLISYKGHGMIEHASKTNSIGHVVNHERRHLAQFESRARARNLDIIKEDISICYKIIDNKIVAVAGKASLIARAQNPTQSQITQSDSIDINEPASPMSAESEKESINDIDRLVNRIEAALVTINNRLEGLSDNESEKRFDKSADKTRLETKRERLESKLNELKSKKLEITQKEILGGLAELMADASNLIKAIYTAKSGNENQRYSDKYSKIEVPDYPTQYTGLMMDATI
jgi:hypothetical protein